MISDFRKEVCYNLKYFIIKLLKVKLFNTEKTSWKKWYLSSISLLLIFLAIFANIVMKTSETGFIHYFPSSFHLIQTQEKDESIANDILIYN